MIDPSWRVCALHFTLRPPTLPYTLRLSMVKIDLSGISPAPTHMSSDIVSSVIDKTGVLLPFIVVTMILLACIYHDRLVFTRPNRPNMTVPDGALPLIGHTYTMVKQGAKGQFERMQMWTASE